MKALLPLALLALSACSQDRPRLVLPPVARLTETPAPVPPTDPTDETVARFIADQDAALRVCNADKDFVLQWVKAAGR